MARSSAGDICSSGTQASPRRLGSTRTRLQRHASTVQQLDIRRQDAPRASARTRADPQPAPRHGPAPSSVTASVRLHRASPRASSRLHLQGRIRALRRTVSGEYIASTRVGGICEASGVVQAARCTRSRACRAAGTRSSARKAVEAAFARSVGQALSPVGDCVAISRVAAEASTRAAWRRPAPGR